MEASDKKESDKKDHYKVKELEAENTELNQKVETMKDEMKEMLVEM